MSPSPTEPADLGRHVQVAEPGFAGELAHLLDRLAHHGDAQCWMIASSLGEQHLVLGVSSGATEIVVGDVLASDLQRERRLADRQVISAPIVLPDGRRAGLLIGAHATEWAARRGRAERGRDDALSALLADTIGSRWAAEFTRVDSERLHDLAAVGKDDLTGLISRPGWDRLVQLEDRRLFTTGGPVGIVAIVVNEVRELNDREGHGAGDELIQRAAMLLTHNVSERSLCARIRGDVLAILAPLRHGETLASLEYDLKDVFDAANISVSVGVAVANGADRLNDVGRRAEEIADRMRAEWDELGSPVFQRKSELATALDSGAIRAYFQPIVDLRSGAVVALEALARWHRGNHVLEPGEFLPELAQHGMLHALFDRILDDGLRWTADYRHRSPDLQLAVNVEFGSISSSGLATQIDERLAAWNLPPSALTLELSERQSFDFDGRLTAELASLSQRGVELVLDDFGTGFASLETLTRLPIDGVKLDRRFISQIGKGEREHAVVKATIAMALELGLLIVAEGIETQAQTEQLVRLGCRLGQGYFMALPLPAEAVHDVIGSPLIPTW